MEEIRITDWIIAGSALANVIVYILLWLTTKKSVDEMRKTTEFFFVSEATKKWVEDRRAQLLRQNFPGLTAKYKLT